MRFREEYKDEEGDENGEKDDSVWPTNCELLDEYCWNQGLSAYHWLITNQ